MTQSLLFPIVQGGPGRGSTSAAHSSATGRIAWSHELAAVATPYWPADLLVWNSHLLASAYDSVTLFDFDGRTIWTRSKQGGSPVGIAANGNLYYKSRSLFLDAVDLKGNAVLKSAPFPGALDKDVRVEGFWPRATDFIAVLRDPPEQEIHLKSTDAPDKEPGGPTLTIVRNDYPTPYGDWLKEYPSQSSLKPLQVPGKSVVALVLDGQIVRVDADKKAELPRFPAPLREMVAWSVDTDEVYVIAGYEHGHKVLVAVSGAGETLWRWDDTTDSDSWAALQSPIRPKGNRIYALTEGRVLAFDAGRLAWTYDLRSEGLRHGSALEDGSFEIVDGKLLAKSVARHATALGDGSLLVTSGKTLFLLSVEGSKRFALALDADILSAPAVDVEGRIYVTTATHLFQIN